jgi:leucyl/phenylalanyl-tRNA--protein transferase
MVPWLDDNSLAFPDTRNALNEPNGLLAVGGDLSPQRLVQAYRLGIFPWYQDDQPILWWSPSPRCILFPKDVHISKSLGKALRKSSLEVTFDTAFSDVMRACAEPRNYCEETWITDDMLTAYTQLHQAGIAHSVEVWQDKKLVGGLYGLSIGSVFFGESMFSRQCNASKIALVALSQKLVKQGFELIDCQVRNEHLMSLGAKEISRNTFEGILKIATHRDITF